MSVACLSLASQLIEAHQTGKVVSNIQTLASLQDAMQIQHSVADGLGESIAGWKVAIHPEYGAVTAPLFKGLTRQSPAEWPWSEGLSLEVEIAVRLKCDLPRATYTRADIIESIHSVSLGLELIKPRLLRGSEESFGAFLADNLGNAGYILGQEQLSWKEFDLQELVLSVRMGEKCITQLQPYHPQCDPLAPLLAYAAVQNDQLGGLLAGQIVTTGSLCGLIAISEPGKFHVALTALNSIEVNVT